MNVIRDSNQRHARGIVSSGDKSIAPAIISCLPVLKAVLLVFFGVCLLLADGQAAASDVIEQVGSMVQVKNIAQITVDDDNRPLNLPLSVFFDPVEEEIYLINGGINRVVVYGPDFFPRMSIGSGRGVLTPRGMRVMSNGEVFISQARTSRNPSPRITVLNGAFFVDREIFLDQIPEAADFVPKQMAISRDNIIYLAFENMRGVLVLDSDGNFLRLLQPQDEITVRGIEEAEKLAAGEEEQTEQEEEFSVEIEEVVPEEEMYADVPEEFRPRSSQDRISESQEMVGPAKINHINIDSAGNLYLISAETGKIYVYNPDESFRFSFGQKGGSPGQMSLPMALTIDEENGLIYVVDYMRHTILAFEMNTGEYVFEFGGRGYSPGWFSFPSDITINNYGQVIVADRFNRRVQVLEVGLESASVYIDELLTETLPESPDDLESAEQDEPASGQQDGPFEEEIIDEPVAGQSDDPFEEEIIDDPGAGQLERSAQAEPGLTQELEGPAVETEPLPEVSKPEDKISPTPAVPRDQLPPVAEAEDPKTQPVKTPAEPSEPGMPDLDAVDAFVQSWAEAWEQQDIETYLSHYSRDFSTPDGISITAWEKERHKRLGRPKFIRIGILDMQIQKLHDSRAQATFIQEYQTDTYADQGMKTLELIWENGDWLIIKEMWVEPVPEQEPEGPAVETEPLPEASKPADKISPVPAGPRDQPTPAAEAEDPKTLSVAASEEPRKPDIPAAEPPDLDAVDAFVRSWAEAWEQQEIETYLSHYSRDFSTPGGISIKAWEKQRQQSLGRPKFIKIGILDLQIQKLNDSRAQVIFIQEYQSDTYTDQVLKTLELIWENGDWLIIKETTRAQ